MNVKYLFLVLACLLAPTSLAATDIRICYESNALSPLMEGEHLVPHSNRGWMVEHVLHAAKVNHFNVTLYRSTWKRCIRDVMANRADALFAMIWSKKRTQQFRFPLDASGNPDRSRALWKLNYTVFSNRTIWDGKQFSQLKNGIGAPSGYIAEKKLQQAGVLSKISYSPKEGFKMIAANRLDGYVIGYELGMQLIGELELKNKVIPLPLPLFTDYLYLPVSFAFYEQHMAQVEQMWATLKTRHPNVMVLQN